ncbi:MAG: hypothetical protein NZZ41_05760 [Candidatus Dojkabacteria bacterium]|nr:hypothetical protein [Candidatus Dojkabacteria bacterium]
MRDLSLYSGFPLIFNTNKSSLEFQNDFKFFDCDVVKISDIRNILLSKSVVYPDIVYYRYKQITSPMLSKSPRNFQYDIFVLPNGNVGIEFVKTHIYFSGSNEDQNKIDSIVQVFTGQVILILQKYHNVDVSSIEYLMLPTKIECCYLIKLNAGDRFFIPPGYFYSFTNIHYHPAVFGFVTVANKTHVNYDVMLHKEKGLALFLIQRGSKVEIVRNSQYKLEPKVKILTLNKFYSFFPDFDVPDTDKLKKMNNLWEVYTYKELRKFFP